MALALYDRVQQTGTANTTVSFTLSGTVTGFQSFSVIGNTNTTYYAATDSSGNWEVGLGTYSTTGPTLTRTTIYSSSNAGSAVTFSGAVSVFVTYPAGNSVVSSNNYGTSGQVLTSGGTGVAPTWGTLGIAGGGTNATTASITSFNNITGYTASGATGTTSTNLVFSTAPTVTNPTLTGFIETVYAATGTTPALSPTNGTIQTWTLSGSSTPTAGTWTAGASMTLQITASTNTVTWTSVAVSWIGGTAPTLSTTGITVIELWKVGSTVYGALVGSV